MAGPVRAASVSVAAHGAVPRAEIDRVVTEIARRYQPRRIILFGSHAYGAPTAESDVDLLVVMTTTLSPARQAVEICQGISYRFALDLFVYTPARLADRMALGDPFIREVMERGQCLYASIHA